MAFGSSRAFSVASEVSALRLLWAFPKKVGSAASSAAAAKPARKFFVSVFIVSIALAASEARLAANMLAAVAAPPVLEAATTRSLLDVSRADCAVFKPACNALSAWRVSDACNDLPRMEWLLVLWHCVAKLCLVQ
ncbi:uncharacterized protein TEOVI_000523800 [Trypanosoma equiperdum]|uniref:Uncharacterized protein n=1 Tax=Trypanosoma equiperdum TaxID=5694 RepID=A0A1G4I0C1_TRYEQ|nr:hypothetical protein TEOVI_000523800 [Trypanosoma equiperdum]